MARYVNELKLLYEPNSTFEAIKQYLEAEGFKYMNYKGEMVFKKGKGVLVAPTFIKVSFSDRTVRVESWLKYALLPGVYVGELGWDGFVGCAAKGTMKRCVPWIEKMLGNVPVNAPAAYVQPQIPQQTAPVAAGQPATAVKFCPGCGKPVNPEGKFCTACGKQIR